MKAKYIVTLPHIPSETFSPASQLWAMGHRPSPITSPALIGPAIQPWNEFSVLRILQSFLCLPCISICLVWNHFPKFDLQKKNRIYIGKVWFLTFPVREDVADVYCSVNKVMYAQICVNSTEIKVVQVEQASSKARKPEMLSNLSLSLSINMIIHLEISTPDLMCWVPARGKHTENAA